MPTGFDWGGFEQVLTDALVRTVQTVIAQRPDQRFYAAAWGEIYRETDGAITLPMFGMNSREAVQQRPAEHRADVAWSIADREEFDLDWLPANVNRRWQQELTAFARRGNTRQWEQTFGRYLTALVTACRRARRRLRDSGVVDRDFLVLVLDHEHAEVLLRRVLSERELHRHFPDLDRRRVEMARIAALPPGEQARHYVSLLGDHGGLVSAEDAAQALITLGLPAAAASIPLLGRAGQAWQAAKLLADLGLPDGQVIEALTIALDRLDGLDHLWVARALARLGRLDVVLARADRLARETVVTAVAAPYGSFRDHGRNPLALDYRPLEEVLRSRPEYATALADELTPGTTPCRINTDEVDEALRGLRSPHVVVRRHAVSVLGDRQLGRLAGQRILPALSNTMVQDQDPTVRRLAVLSLQWWQRDAHAYLAVVRSVLDDPVEEVRAAAAYWIREHDGLLATTADTSH
ncbi:DUF4303 domain-containing protein [Micromonospora fiedleri]|uniref:DUF4303 domain-containing protein n=1 Tax=Micromonospora fiedleri TaxID=1157498 RepID=A0ABS1UVD9_9ACTN|nr:DUF4303 domain-containing protein [Micromonospora fiedleri]MBL6280337.1 DUF4303 domain-containing protein [Micromonospora fiedleri]